MQCYSQDKKKFYNIEGSHGVAVPQCSIDECYKWNQISLLCYMQKQNINSLIIHYKRYSLSYAIHVLGQNIPITIYCTYAWSNVSNITWLYNYKFFNIIQSYRIHEIPVTYLWMRNK